VFKHTDAFGYGIYSFLLQTQQRIKIILILNRNISRY